MQREQPRYDRAAHTPPTNAHRERQRLGAGRCRDGAAGRGSETSTPHAGARLGRSCRHTTALSPPATESRATSAQCRRFAVCSLAPSCPRSCPGKHSGGDATPRYLRGRCAPPAATPPGSRSRPPAPRQPPATRKKRRAESPPPPAPRRRRQAGHKDPRRRRRGGDRSAARRGRRVGLTQWELDVATAPYETSDGNLPARLAARLPLGPDRPMITLPCNLA
ncbi:zinc finger protein ZFPM1-like [Melanerpes formicivorus]|uniref:zinc finger protein ZFPM1-like n=1 Tax=Melanerpes formicivorus TaxID=211600 RepID=UPI00358FBEC1